MNISFAKYHGTGNDFILIDGSSDELIEHFTPELVHSLCHRRTGIGADGLIIISPDRYSAFQMHYYNADGYPGSMCGNGGRCSVYFAHQEGLIGDLGSFTAMDGRHRFKINHVDDNQGNISISLISSVEIRQVDECSYELNTGSPHLVKIVPDLSTIDAFNAGKAIRQSPPYATDGINVNFIQLMPDRIKITTYERGVEDVTLSCGTGVTASAMVAHCNYGYKFPITVEAAGGKLEVSMTDQIYLTGPVVKVYEGFFNLK